MPFTLVLIKSHEMLVRRAAIELLETENSIKSQQDLPRKRVCTKAGRLIQCTVETSWQSGRLAMSQGGARRVPKCLLQPGSDSAEPALSAL